MPPEDIPATPEKSDTPTLDLGQTGVVIYAERDTRPLDLRVPACGDMTADAKLLLADLMGPGWLSCLAKVANSGVPDSPDLKSLRFCRTRRTQIPTLA